MVTEIQTWLRHNPTLSTNAPLIPNRHGRAMTRANVNHRLDIAVSRATEVYRSLARLRKLTVMISSM
jgi:hypothetical protein